MIVSNPTPTNFNIYINAGARLIINTDTPKPRQIVGDPYDSDRILEAMSKKSREDTIRWETERHVNFYNGDEETLVYTPGEESLDVEIAKATQSGYASVINGTLTAKFYVEETSSSPLDFATKVDNLKRLYEKYGASAAEHSAKFEDALQEIITEFTTEGGRYVAADKNGVADSIRAMFRGEEGIYSAEDMKTMAALSFETVADKYGRNTNEFHLGALLGYDAGAIEMAYKAGKLSDAAYQTTQRAFRAYADDEIKRLNDYLEWQKNDPFRQKGFTYSPVRRDLVQKAIDTMLQAFHGKDLTYNLRKALSELENAYNAHSEGQYAQGSVDERYRFDGSIAFFNRPIREKFSYAAVINSSFFSRYLGKPAWAVRGNLFSVSVSV